MPTRTKFSLSTKSTPISHKLLPIENLYQVFAKYRLRPDIEACPCCVTESDKERLQKKKLKELTVDDLGKYVFKAVTTWGQEYDFKHFLPRILELLNDFGSVRYMVFIKLHSLEWQTWPAQEKDAIVAYLESILESMRYEHSQRPDSTLTEGMSLETYDLEIDIEEISDFLNNKMDIEDISEDLLDNESV